jgi:hypothetical protein
MTLSLEFGKMHASFQPGLRLGLVCIVCSGVDIRSLV